MSTYLLYPGCAWDSSARAYALSTQAVCEVLGVELQPIEDWNCCGATEYLSVDTVPAYALISRNLALAAQQRNGSRTVTAPCSLCYLNLNKADHFLSENPALNDKVNRALAAGGMRYQPGSLQVRHLLDIMLNDVGLEAIRAHVTRPLHGLRVAPYLGCLLARPDYHKRFSSPNQPYELDRLLAALGAEVVDYPLRTQCCGGHMTQIGPETAYELLRRLLHGAAQYSAHVIATVCPMCQLNLDAYQGDVNRHFGTHFQIPVLFFTQLMGLAFGLEASVLGFGMELVEARGALAHLGEAAPSMQEPPSKAARRRKEKSEGLPMPPMPAESPTSEEKS
ncbi:MAG: CoB--CoM heterodisulfide reductase iron-sulfur subunit B family protein [Anaerolineales bacterium]